MESRNRNFFFSISNFILIFLFSLFALSNLGFVFKISINQFYIPLAFLISSFYLYKSGNFLKKILSILIIFLLSFFFAHLLIDTSFDGRCYHFTLENLFKLGYNPIYGDMKEFANNHNIYYNILFANSYPNALEILRSNFYYIFNNMETSKIVNFLFAFAGFFYSYYFFLIKLSKRKSLILSLCVFLCAVVICQITTKMADFALYYLFLFQLFSIILVNKKINKKENLAAFIISSVLAIATKYVGILNTLIIFLLWIFFKRRKIVLKTGLITLFITLILCFQPYITNIKKFKNPFYPSIGYNKLDFMTKQNPKEFKNKPYLYKFFRSMFSSASDARMNNPQTPKLYYKIPFTSHYDMPYCAEDVRINGFGHLFSGIFIVSVVLSIIQIRRKKGILPLVAILSTVLLNPICWWARFVPQLHLLPIINCYYFRKNNLIFCALSFLILFNGLWVMKENISVNAYKTNVINKFYNNLYVKSQNKPIEVYMSKAPFNEDDTTILFRMNEYGVKYKMVDKLDKDFNKIKTDATITDSYWIK